MSTTQTLLIFSALLILVTLLSMLAGYLLAMYVPGMAEGNLEIAARHRAW